MQIRRCVLSVSFIVLQLPAQSPPTINPNGVVNGATGVSSSSVPVASRGEIVFIYGTNLSTTIASANTFPLPTQLGGTQVRFGSIAAPLLYVSPNQVNVEVPFEIPDVNTVNLVVQSGNETSQPLSLVVLAQDPGIYAVFDSTGKQISASNPVQPGESILIQATGLGVVAPAVSSGQPGPLNPLSVTAITPVVNLGNQTAVVTFSGLEPGQIVYQINATAPSDLPGPTSNVALAPGVLPGVTGPPGPTGPVGPAGPAGTAGANGPTGAVGPMGLPGPTGSIGPAGPAGPAGQAGSNGPAGSPGPPGLTWRGAWNNSTAYMVNDAVEFNGSSYVSVQPGTGHQPDTSPTFWSLLAQAGSPGGATGPTGATGPAGAAGATGPAGATGATGPAGAAGATGPAGAAGATGPAGAAGPQGATGAAGPGGIIGGSSGKTHADSCFMGLYSSDCSSTESDVQLPIPRSGTISNFYFHTFTGGNGTITINLHVNGNTTAITCVTVGGSCSDTTHTVLVTSGQLITVDITGMTNQQAEWSAQFD